MTEETMPTIYTDPSQSPTTVEIMGSMEMLESKLENMPKVANADDAALVSEYRAQFAKQAKALDKERLEMTAGARETVTRMNQKYNVIIERAKRMTTLASNLLMPWMKEQERIREEAERIERERKAEEDRLRREEEEALAEAERIANETADAAAMKKAEDNVAKAKKGLDEISRKPSMPAPPKSVKGSLGSSTGLRKIWKYRVTDITKVPEEYLVDPEARIKKGAVNAVAKRDKDNAFIPGIEFYSDDSLSSSTATKI